MNARVYVHIHGPFQDAFKLPWSWSCGWPQTKPHTLRLALSNAKIINQPIPSTHPYSNNNENCLQYQDTNNSVHAKI